MVTARSVEQELAEIRSLGRPLRSPADLDPLLERIGNARFVLLGEASHGTAEYYDRRAELTRRLISELDFSFVAVEGDWPDCFRVNRWLKNRSDVGRSGREVLSRFERWPTWMWANEQVARFVDWLRAYNLRSGASVGFYGLDVYSLWDSMRAVVEHLGRHQPEAVAAALHAYRCFEPYGEDPQRYARATRLVPTDCEKQVVDLLVELRRRAASLDGDPEASLDAVQNAEVVRGAEEYYRTMVRGSTESWNVRDCHMADTLDRLVQHHGPGAKAVVWEHNTHVGDARATDMTLAEMVNVGQLVRERHEDEGVVLVGFAGHRGSVIAARQWGAPMQVMPVPPAPEGTHEQLIHEAVGEAALFLFPDSREGAWLSSRRGHRAIGVVYDPEGDRRNWVPSVLGRRYDALCSFDETRALDPLHREVPQPRSEQETYPWNT